MSEYMSNESYMSKYIYKEEEEVGPTFKHLTKDELSRLIKRLQLLQSRRWTHERSSLISVLNNLINRR